MFDWIKFFPIELRDGKKSREIRGPYLPSTRQIKWHFGDSSLLFKAPRSNNLFSFSSRGWRAQCLSPKRKDIISSEWDRVYLSSIPAPKSEWNLDHFYANEWIFVGPWFTGFEASLSSNALLVSPTRDSSFADKHLFHPRSFELAIANYLDRTYGYTKVGRKPHYRGPLNWQVLDISSTIRAVVCDIHTIGNSAKDNPLLTRLVLFPITPSKFIRIDFDFGGIEIFRDKVRFEPLSKLCDTIIDSIRLDVGSKTKAEWEKVKATCPDMSITDSFGELPWPLKYEKPSKKKKEKDITPGIKTIEG